MTKLLKKLPYGESDFKRANSDEFYYIDKTHFIPKLEAAPSYLFFLRPRRFGKSLLISTLEYYYDEYYADQFSTIFQDTYILDNPTSLKNSMKVMKFDFSAVDVTNYKDSFYDHLNKVINDFIDKYKLDPDKHSKHIFSNNPVDRLSRLFSYCSMQEHSIYILIDEYDNFVNKILMSDVEEYKGLVSTNEAFYKEFFTILKVGTSGTDAPVRKMFFTGVSPLALFDVTSGNNINANISMDKEFNDLAGITQTELKQLINYYQLDDKAGYIIEQVNHWYNNYRFNEDVEHTIYNSDMILYYIKHLLKSGEDPKQMVDINVRTDYSKLKYLLFTNNKLNGNFAMLNELISGEDVVITEIKDGFSAFEMLNVENFGSLLFALGLVTIEKKRLSVKLSLPNQTIKQIIADFIEHAYKDIEFNLPLQKFNQHLENFAFQKDLTVFHYLNQEIAKSSSIRDYIDGESFVKGAVITYLNLNPYYEIMTEKEVTHLNIQQATNTANKIEKGYIDFLLNPAKKEIEYGAIIELKYISKSDYSEAKLQAKIKEAQEQLNHYDVTKVPHLSKKPFVKIILVFKAWEMVYCEEYY